jgi:hypothetical protein
LVVWKSIHTRSFADYFLSCYVSERQVLYRQFSIPCANMAPCSDTQLEKISQLVVIQLIRIFGTDVVLVLVKLKINN